jgi:hypothetical protein
VGSLINSQNGKSVKSFFSKVSRHCTIPGTLMSQALLSEVVMDEELSQEETEQNKNLERESGEMKGQDSESAVTVFLDSCS